MKTIYLDHSATTAVKPEVLEAMIPYFTENYGNPSSIYLKGREGKNAIENARDKVAKAIGATSKEIFFTASGSESDNWAIRGVALANTKKGRHIITSNIEHHAVLNTCKRLEKDGFEVTYLPVENNGILDPAKVETAIRPDTTLVTVMYVNSEIGTIQPINEIGKITRAKGVYFHTDAVQAIGHIPIDVASLNVDLLSLTAHKFYGPKGIGSLYIKNGTKIQPLIYGGNQERARRAGTENVAGIVGLGKAIELATTDIEAHNKKLIALRDRTIEAILTKIPYTRLNGDRYKRISGNVNISFEFIEGESLLLMLDLKGIAGSSGSACTSGSLDPSHVLLALGLPHEIAHGSLRLTFGDENTDSDVDYLLEMLTGIVDKLRQMSPLYERVKRSV